mmetsp:Transcript_1137/g.3509  ORF Transcript_1137/g.3509 Transcript_1137/m.3509 type:complete len:207 (-) Transcript_1137:3789-4409(-)
MAQIRYRLQVDVHRARGVFDGRQSAVTVFGPPGKAGRGARPGGVQHPVLVQIEHQAPCLLEVTAVITDDIGECKAVGGDQRSILAFAALGLCDGDGLPDEFRDREPSFHILYGKQSSGLLPVLGWFGVFRIDIASSEISVPNDDGVKHRMGSKRLTLRQELPLLLVPFRVRKDGAASMRCCDLLRRQRGKLAVQETLAVPVQLSRI